MSDHSRIAGENFRKGYNCAQSVFTAFADEMGLDTETAARLASSMGAGMGRLREVCGAMSGALMVLGYLRGYSDPADLTVKREHYARVQRFANRFKAENETWICRELLKDVPASTSPDVEARTEEYYTSRPCLRLVQCAARIVDEMLAEEPATRVSK